MMKDKNLVEREKGRPGTDVPNLVVPLVFREGGEPGGGGNSYVAERVRYGIVPSLSESPWRSVFFS
jgi:hypothetical protein